MEAISFAHYNLLLNNAGFLVSLVYCGYSWYLSRLYIGKNKLASIPIEIPSLKRRPPIPGFSSHGLDGAPPLPFKKLRTPVSGVSSLCQVQELIHKISLITRSPKPQPVAFRGRSHVIMSWCANGIIFNTSHARCRKNLVTTIRYFFLNEERRSLYSAAWYWCWSKLAQSVSGIN